MGPEVGLRMGMGEGPEPNTGSVVGVRVVPNGSGGRTKHACSGVGLRKGQRVGPGAGPRVSSRVSPGMSPQGVHGGGSLHIQAQE